MYAGQYTEQTQTSMPRVGFELTIPVFGRMKIFHDLDGTTTVIVYLHFKENNYFIFNYTYRKYDSNLNIFSSLFIPTPVNCNCKFLIK
jgi:hypothetical protein